MNLIGFKEFIIEAGSSAERQENGFIFAINNSVEENGGEPIVLKTKKEMIKDVISAHKYTGRQKSGSEPYTDVQIVTKKSVINISMKGDSAPSLAGGGMRGMEEVIPGIANKFMVSAFNKLIALKYKTGDNIPDIFGKLNDRDKRSLVIGTAAMGGPIDYMYIGPMSVDHKFDNGILTVNGSLIDSKHYADSHELYFRFRSRRHDQRFDPNAFDKNKTPKIYGVSPSRGDSAGRIVITDRVSSKGIIVDF